MDRPSHEELSSVIGEIYDCALSPEGWTGVLTRITAAIDAAYTTISLTSLQESRGRFAAQSPWDAERMQALQDYELDQIPGLKEAVFGDVDVPVMTLSVVSEAELHRTPFYRDWAGPQGLRDACTTKFVHTPDRIGLLSTTTYAGRETIGAEGQRFLALLSPHLRRASLIGDLLDHARVSSHLYRSVLDDLAVPVVLTGSEGAIRYANAAADRMLSAEVPLLSVHGILSARGVVAARALKDALASAAEADLSVGSRGIGLPVSAPGEPPAVAYVLPLSDGTARAAFRPASAAVLVSTTTGSSPLPDAVLATLFDLTPAEARVFLLAGGGVSPSKCATLLGIADNTVKTHLGRIYEKTGTRRHADLVGLMASLGTPFAIASKGQSAIR